MIGHAFGKISLTYAINKGADQPVHSHSLISALVFRLLDSIKVLFEASKFSSFSYTSVAEHDAFSITLLACSILFGRNATYIFDTKTIGQDKQNILA